MYQASAGIT
jgi:hypothetical protein